MITRILVGALILVGCKGNAAKESPPPATGSGSGSGSGSAIGSGSGSGSAKAPAAPVAKAGSGSGSAAVVAEDPKARAAYRAGMRKGRKATDAKNWVDAIAGFDAALAAKKNDPRALGERGFAKLLEGTDLVSAARDLDLAASGTKDPKVLSSIWFNRGLIAEKQGNGPNAIASFVIANTLRPTEAARKRITGNACPVLVERELVAGDYKPVDAANWAALVNAIAAEVDAESKPPSTAPALPAIVRGGAEYESVDYLVLASGAGLRAVPLGVAQSAGRCPGTLSFELVERDATRIHVHGSEQYEGGYTYMCEGKDDERVECTGAENEVSAGTACLGGSPSLHDAVLDAATGKVLIDITQLDEAPTAKVTLDPAGAKLSGPGCARVEKL